MNTKLKTNNLIKFLSIGSIVVGSALASYSYLAQTQGKPDVLKSFNTGTVNILQKAFTSQAPIYSDTISPEQKAHLEKIGDFSLDSNLADNQVSRKVSQIQFSNKDYFLSLVSEAEGFRSKIYNDNIGYAIGNGWNISMQSKDYNQKIASLISNDDQYISKVASLSSKTSTQKASGEYSKITITPQRSLQVAAFMAEDFKKEGVLKNLEPYVKKHATGKKLINQGENPSKLTEDLFHKLQPNEQAALIYHTYKVGARGASNYKNLLNNLTDYLFKENKTLDDKKNIAENFTYKYKINGQTLQDVRASVLISSMFVSPDVFGHFIQKTVAPKKYLDYIPQIKSNSIDNLDNIPDPKGDLERKIIESGSEISTQMVYDPSIGYERPRAKGGLYFRGI